MRFASIVHVKQKQFVFYSLYSLEPQQICNKKSFCQHTVSSEANKLALLTVLVEYKIRKRHTERSREKKKMWAEMQMSFLSVLNVQSFCFMLDMEWIFSNKENVLFCWVPSMEVIKMEVWLVIGCRGVRTVYECTGVWTDRPRSLSNDWSTKVLYKEFEPLLRVWVNVRKDKQYFMIT